jgi:hypothetical protein
MRGCGRWGPFAGGRKLGAVRTRPLANKLVENDGEYGRRHHREQAGRETSYKGRFSARRSEVSECECGNHAHQNLYAAVRHTERSPVSDDSEMIDKTAEAASEPSKEDELETTNDSCWCDWAASEGMTHDEWIAANNYPDHEPAPEWNVPERDFIDRYGWDDAADSTASDLDDQAEDDPDSEFALVDNGWLARLVRG